MCLKYLIITTALGGEYNCYPHFIDGDTRRVNNMSKVMQLEKTESGLELVLRHQNCELWSLLCWV